MKRTVSLLLALLLLLSLAACGGSKKVTVIDGKAKTEIEVDKKATVADVLKKAGLTLEDNDKVSPDRDAVPEDGAVITVTRADADVKLTLVIDGKTVEVSVPLGASVADALKAAGVVTGEKDRVSVDLEKVADAGTQIEVTHMKEIKIVTPEQTYTVEMLEGTVKDALDQAGVKLSEDMNINVKLSLPVSELNGDVILSKQRMVSVTVDGEAKTLPSAAATVGAFLAENNIALGPNDRVTPAKDAAIADDTQIVVVRIEIKTETVTETVKFTTQTEYSDALEKGKSQTKQAGVNGEKQVTYEITLADGKEESRKAVSETVTKAAVPAIVVQGTKEVDPATVEVSRVAFPDCDDPSHGYYEITYADGHTEFVDY